MVLCCASLVSKNDCSTCIIFYRSDADYQGNVVSNCTFSKIFGPGLRLGWMELPEKVRNSILGTGLSISGGGFNHCISGIMESIISLGLLSEMLKESRPLYRVSMLLILQRQSRWNFTLCIYRSRARLCTAPSKLSYRQQLWMNQLWVELLYFIVDTSEVLLYFYPRTSAAATFMIKYTVKPPIVDPPR